MLKITMPQSTIFMGSKAEHQVTLIVVRMADGGVTSGVACCIVVMLVLQMTPPSAHSLHGAHQQQE